MSQRSAGSANAPLPPLLVLLGPGGGPSPFFPYPLNEGMERREAPGRIAALVRQVTWPAGRTSRSAIAPTAISPSPRIAADGVRAANDVGRCASRGYTVTPLSGATPRSHIQRRDRRRPR